MARSMTFSSPRRFPRQGCAIIARMARSAMPTDCRVSGTQDGVSYSIKPKKKWYAETMRLTISGHTSCAPRCIRAIDAMLIQYIENIG